MNERTNNPAGRLPDERAMLAFVEGDLAGPEELAFRRALRHAPEVVVRLEAMRRDKALLRATMLRETLVPGTLVARVEESIGREALFSAASGEAGVYADPVAPMIRTRVVGRPWAAPGMVLAAAAGVALVIGGVLLVVQPRGGPPPELVGGLAPDTGPGAATDGRGLAAATGEQGSMAAREGDPQHIGEGEIASAAALADEPRVIPDALAAALDPGPLGISEGTRENPFADPSAERPSERSSTRLIPGAVARSDLMALAEQHRLALRVSADEPREVIAVLEAAVASGEDVPWRTVGDPPVRLAGALGVAIRPFDEGAARGWPAEPSGPSGTAPVDPPAERVARSDESWLLRPTEDALAVYLAEVDMTPEGLARLDRDLSSRGHSRSGFAALADPLDRVLGEPAMLVPAHDVIWWYHPPREWSRRTLVPVVIERR